MSRLRAAWEVRAGLIPRQPMEEYSKRFSLTENDERSAEVFEAKRKQAMDYAAELMNPHRFNWVHVEWIWL